MHRSDFAADISDTARQTIDMLEHQGARSVSIWRHRKLAAAVIMGYEPVSPINVDPPRRRWHLSLSGPGRVPTWDELRDVVHSFRPGVMFCIALPPRDLWVNVDSNTLHVWEIQDEDLVAMWREEGQLRRDRPT